MKKPLNVTFHVAHVVHAFRPCHRRKRVGHAIYTARNRATVSRFVAAARDAKLYFWS